MKHKHHLDFPHITLSAKSIGFDPIKYDDDELTVAITNAPNERDDTWELVERPDAGELTRFWTEVVDDVSHDPEWVKLSAD